MYLTLIGVKPVGRVSPSRSNGRFYARKAAKMSTIAMWSPIAMGYVQKYRSGCKCIRPPFGLQGKHCLLDLRITIQYNWALVSPFLQDVQKCTYTPRRRRCSGIHSFIQTISIAPLQAHFYSVALQTQHGYYAGVSRRSATGNCELRTCPRSLRGG